MKIMVAFLGSKKKQQHKKDTFLHNKIEKKKREEFYRIKSQKSEKRNKNKSESRQDLFDVLSNFPKKKAYQRRGARKIERDYKRRSAFEDTNRILRSTNQEIVASKLIFLTFYLKYLCCCLVAKLSKCFATRWKGSPPGFSVLGIFQARIMKGASISFSRGSS